MRAAGDEIPSHVLIDARLVECRGLPNGAVAVPMTDPLTAPRSLLGRTWPRLWRAAQSAA
jgi:hypothetical protein